MLVETEFLTLITHHFWSKANELIANTMNWDMFFSH